MKKRKSISKKLRFEVFKRDGFTCQYCGAHPPEVILECDHIHPLAAGGTDEESNLITACFNCNRGKSDNQLSDVPQSLNDRAKEVIEREEQIHGYQAAMNARKARIESEAQQVLAVYERFAVGYTLTEKSMVSVRFFIEKLGVHEVLSAMEHAFTSHHRVKNEFRYFCGICWNRIRAMEV